MPERVLFRAPRPRLLETLDAAYDLAADGRAWLRGVLESLAWLDAGMGVAGYTFEYDGTRVRPQITIGVRGAERFVSIIRDGQTQIDPRDVREAFAVDRIGIVNTSVDWIWRVFKRAESLAALRRLLPPEIGDFLGVCARATSRAGVILWIPLPRPTRYTRSDKAAVARLTAHIATAHRLRLHLGSAAAGERSTSLAAAEGILRPDGGLEHASSAAVTAARQRLREAACRIGSAKRSARRDSHGALEMWRALVEGRWSLVDHFDSDGKRLLIVHENPAEAPPVRALTTRERQVAALAAACHPNKLIAYELGLAPSTVSGALASALAKLGLGHRAELVRALRLARERPIRPRG
jgi:DNA-binding NarL/FixJ family response regulator